MDGNLPKVSFIPKSPLARPETFMERKRPRSVVGILAVVFFVASVGAYAGLYFYERSLTSVIGTMTDKIEEARKTLAQAPEINEAKVFRLRADLAKALLDQHVIATPVFDFIQRNTLQSIFYDDFSFKQDKDMWTLNLAGEAPSYASLAYQADVLRGKKDEIADFGVSDVTLTKFGAVTFKLAITFNQKKLSYTATYAGVPAGALPTTQETTPSVTPSLPTTAPAVPAAPTVPTPFEVTAETPSATSSQATTTEAPVPGWSVAPVAPTTAPEAVVPAPAQESWWSSLWSRFKFW